MVIVMKNKKLITGIVLFILSISIFAFTLTNHLIELNDMKECAQTPGCMYCLPKWGVAAFILYFVSFILSIFAVICLVSYVKQRKHIQID